MFGCYFVCSICYKVITPLYVIFLYLYVTASVLVAFPCLLDILAFLSFYILHHLKICHSLDCWSRMYMPVQISVCVCVCVCVLETGCLEGLFERKMSRYFSQKLVLLWKYYIWTLAVAWIMMHDGCHFLICRWIWGLLTTWGLLQSFSLV